MTAKERSRRPSRTDAPKPHLKLLADAPLPHSLSQYLTVAEVATLLRCRPSTIYQLVHKKKIPFRKAGRQLLFEAREIDEWTKECAGR